MRENIYKLKELTIKVNVDGTIRNVTDKFGYFNDFICIGMLTIR